MLYSSSVFQIFDHHYILNNGHKLCKKHGYLKKIQYYFVIYPNLFGSYL